jgi:SpoVK/Ycf46/Vps4 family AAA+-type ATPase
MNFYDLRDPPFNYSYFNHFYYYSEKNKKYPNVFECRVPILSSIVEKIKSLPDVNQVYTNQIESVLKNKDYSPSNTVIKKHAEYIFEYLDCLIIISSDRSIHSYHFDIEENQNKDNCYLKVLYQSEENLEKIKSLVEYNFEKPKNKINLLCRFEGELSTQDFEISLPEENLDLELNYGKDLVKKNEKLIDQISKNKSGLALFSGPPGTGKSTYIKCLAKNITRKILYLSSVSIEELTNPDFITFMLSQRNSVLLLEDAEKVLRSRELEENSAISNILNLSDGVLGDCLNIFIIATFNTNRDQIDPALLRKGRLLLEHQFDKLSIEQCNLIFEKIGSSRTTNVPLTLAEIYNEEDNFVSKEEKRKVGF